MCDSKFLEISNTQTEYGHEKRTTSYVETKRKQPDKKTLGNAHSEYEAMDARFSVVALQSDAAGIKRLTRTT